MRANYRTMLKEVFDLCDDEHTGYIYVPRFAELARLHLDDMEEINKIINTLDPENTGKINFDSFCMGIMQMVKDHGFSMSHVVSEMNLSRKNSICEDQCKSSLDGSTTTFNEYDPPLDDENGLNELEDYACDHGISKSQNGSSEANQSSTNERVNELRPDLVLTRAVSPSLLHKLQENRMSSLYREDMYNNLEDKVQSLEQELSNISEQKFSQSERLMRLQNENSDLRDRLMIIEERVQDIECVGSSLCGSDKEKFFEMMNKTHNEFLEEKDSLLHRIAQIEKELYQAKEDNQTLKKEIKLLVTRVESLDSQLRDSERVCDSLKDANEKLCKRISAQEKKMENDKKVPPVDTAEDKLKNENGYQSAYIKDLEDQLSVLKMESERLREQNEELKQQLLCVQISEGNSLLQNNKENSWASELDLLNKDELLSRVKELQLANNRYHDYIERILLTVMQKDPSLLENIPV